MSFVDEGGDASSLRKLKGSSSNVPSPHRASVDAMAVEAAVVAVEASVGDAVADAVPFIPPLTRVALAAELVVRLRWSIPCTPPSIQQAALAFTKSWSVLVAYCRSSVDIGLYCPSPLPPIWSDVEDEGEDAMVGLLLRCYAIDNGTIGGRTRSVLGGVDGGRRLNSPGCDPLDSRMTRHAGFTTGLLALKQLSDISLTRLLARQDLECGLRRH